MKCLSKGKSREAALTCDKTQGSTKIILIVHYGNSTIKNVPDLNKNKTKYSWRSAPNRNGSAKLAVRSDSSALEVGRRNCKVKNAVIRSVPYPKIYLRIQFGIQNT